MKRYTPILSARASGLILAIALIVSGAFRTAYSQQPWSTPDPNNYNIYKTPTDGNVGVGTSSPTGKLHVKGVATTVVSPVQVLRLDGGITHGLDFGTLSLAPFAWWIQARDNSGYSFFYPLALNPQGGNVGIGTLTPNFKLDVAGNINSNATITGNNIVIKYQDVAEWVPSTEKLPTGTVVVLDSIKSNQVVASTVRYDTRVAGVISEQPGITLGEKGDSKVLVATTGRVRVKVDPTRAPIHIGDLLVTSDVPGVAMKSEPVNLGGVQIHRPGTLIGKALEPLEKGSGSILVLLSLQ